MVMSESCENQTKRIPILKKKKHWKSHSMNILKFPSKLALFSLFFFCFDLYNTSYVSVEMSIDAIFLSLIDIYSFEFVQDKL